MKKIILAISALALATGVAAAAQAPRSYPSAMRAAHPAAQLFSTTGTVESLDPRSKTVQLTTGTKYQLPKTADLRGVAVGEKVRISWTAQDPYGTSFGNSESDEFHANRLVVVR
ncbi:MULTISPECIES: DUF1344 domain-containing protein [Phyllobacterium]|jgi:hypothetical protein|nr:MULTISPECIES: DUF1344 domain-containing protein [Phyllobacterium]UXN63703.1 DUF1344 domain-containing protein [Phyllobacterium sp. A18/5-2]